MAPVLNPEVVRFRIIGTLDTERVENVIHAQRPAGAPWTAEIITTAAQAIYDAYEAEFLPILSTAYTLLRVEGVQVAGPGSLLGTFTDGNSPNGSVPGDCLPFNVAVCATWRTGLSGRSFIGRTYLPGIPESAQANSLLTTSAFDAFNAACADFRLDLNTAGFIPGIYSTRTNNAPRATGLFTPATSFGLSDRVLDSQRGRKPRS